MRIDTESHFWTQGFLDHLATRSEAPYCRPLPNGAVQMSSNTSHEFLGVAPQEIRDLQLDLGEGRIAKMDAARIDVALLSLTVPGVQQLPANEGIAQARATNDALAALIAHHPTRFVGMAAIAPLAPEESAAEIERCVSDLGFRAVNLMGHAGGEHPWLDHPSYRPVFAAAARLGVPVNLHPTVPHAQLIKPYLGYGWGLPTMGLGFGAETAVHTMRLILSGLFDELPDLKMTLGHFGEALSFWTSRLDLGVSSQRTAVVGQGPKCERLPSEYLRKNFWFNSSGLFLNSALISCLFEFGADRIMFASDYPWEFVEDAAAFMDAAPLSPADREKIEWRNAAELFGIDVTVPA
jgi:5-carboxyvanillate decarboxylase